MSAVNINRTNDEEAHAIALLRSIHRNVGSLLNKLDSGAINRSSQHDGASISDISSEQTTPSFRHNLPSLAGRTPIAQREGTINGIEKERSAEQLTPTLGRNFFSSAGKTLSEGTSSYSNHLDEASTFSKISAHRTPPSAKNYLSSLIPRRPPMTQHGGKRSKRENEDFFVIDRVTLLMSPSISEPLNSQSIREHRKNNLIIDGVKFSRGNSKEQIHEIIQKEFSPHLDSLSYEILRQERSNLLPLNLSKSCSFNGTTLWELFKKKKKDIFLRPSKNLPCFIENDSSNENSDVTVYDDSSPPATPESITETENEGTDKAGSDIIIMDDFFLPSCSTAKVVRDSRINDVFENNYSLSSQSISNEAVVANEGRQHNVEEDLGSKPLTLKDAVQPLRSQLSLTENTEWLIDRSAVLKSTWKYMRRPSFNAARPLEITFADSMGLEDDAEALKEEGVDLGGLVREFFTLSLRELENSAMFEGPSGEKVLQYNAACNLDVNGFNNYHLAGQLIAMSILQKGAAPNFFSEHLFESVVEGSITNVTTAAIVNLEVRKDLVNLMNADNLTELREAVSAENCQQAGLTSFPTKMSDRELLIKQFLDFYGKIKIQPILKSFCDGLATYGLLTVIRNSPILFKDVLCWKDEPLTRAKFLGYFKVERSTPGSNKYVIESKSLVLFTDFLEDCKDGIANDEEHRKSLTLEELLFFVAGV